MGGRGVEGVSRGVCGGGAAAVGAAKKVASGAERASGVVRKPEGAGRLARSRPLSTVGRAPQGGHHREGTTGRAP